MTWHDISRIEAERPGYEVFVAEYGFDCPLCGNVRHRSFSSRRIMCSKANCPWRGVLADTDSQSKGYTTNTIFLGSQKSAGIKMFLEE